MGKTCLSITSRVSENWITIPSCTTDSHIVSTGTSSCYLVVSAGRLSCIPATPQRVPPEPESQRRSCNSRHGTSMRDHLIVTLTNRRLGLAILCMRHERNAPFQLIRNSKKCNNVEIRIAHVALYLNWVHCYLNATFWSRQITSIALWKRIQLPFGVQFQTHRSTWSKEFVLRSERGAQRERLCCSR